MPPNRESEVRPEESIIPSLSSSSVPPSPSPLRLWWFGGTAAILLLAAGVFGYWQFFHAFSNKAPLLDASGNVTGYEDSDSVYVVSGQEGYDAQDKDHKYLRGEVVNQKQIIDKTTSSELSIGGNDVYLTNLQTGQTVKLSLSVSDLLLYEGELVGSAGFDPSYKYFSLDLGTSKSRGVIVFDFATGERLTNFCSTQGRVFWQDYVIYGSCNNFPINVEWEIGLPDIIAYNLRTGTSTTLINTKDSQGNYYLYSALSLEGDILRHDSYRVYQNGGRHERADEPIKTSVDLTKVLPET